LDEFPDHIYFATQGYGSCQTDADEIPILDGIVFGSVYTTFFDFRPGYAGNLIGNTGSMSMYFLMGPPKATVDMSIKEAAISLKDGKTRKLESFLSYRLVGLLTNLSLRSLEKINSNLPQMRTSYVLSGN